MQHLQPNTTLQGGKYRIERVLGQGGFGITYLATQLSLQRHVAIKEFFMKDFCSRDEMTLTLQAPSAGSNKLVEQYRKKFIKEARNLARLNHPHIINVMDVFEENDTVYYVMPYLSGGSLHDYVKMHGVLSEQEAMKYVKQIASALKYMHEEQHICHYDVKPANILLDDKGNAVLIDFGISKNYDVQGQETTTTPIGVSEGYAPIEQYQQNIAEFSPASDVYALGATLYFLLHGRTPISAPSRAGGTGLLMRKELSQNTKNLITATMKISKTERAQNMDVFLNDGYQQHKGAENNPPVGYGSNNNSFIGWILGIAVVAIIGFFIFNSIKNQDGVEESLDFESNGTIVETPLSQAESTQTDEVPNSKATNIVQDDDFAFDPWSGKFYIEGGMARNWDSFCHLTLVKNANERYSGEIEISFGLTDENDLLDPYKGRLFGKVKGQSKKDMLTLILSEFDTDDPDDYISYGELKSGQQIFRLRYNGSSYSFEPVGNMGRFFDNMGARTNKIIKQY